MIREVVFVSDFFLEQGVNGGAEFYNDNLMSLLTDSYSFTKVQCTQLTPSFILENKDKFFIVANFMTLTEDNKELLKKEVEYIILEHDHKYAANNNPAFFDNFLVPENMVINKDFFSKARAVLCQSKLHSEIVQKNLVGSNICNLGGNLWTDYQIEVLRESMNNEKTIDYAIMESSNRNKGMPFAIEYCRQKNIQYTMIKNQSYEDFVKELSKVDSLVFFPQWIESYSRVALEARILGCKLITNGMLGVASEDYFSSKPQQLIDILSENNKSILDVFRNALEGKYDKIDFLPPIEFPKITILGTMYNGSKYIRSFLDSIVSQTNFSNCELIIIDANSPDNEYEIIKEYTATYDNIIYKRMDEKISIAEALNIGIEMSTGDFLTFGLIDDIRDPDCLSILSKHLHLNPGIDLVYGQCLQTDSPNETMDNNTSDDKFYEHSTYDFSKNSMIKCLPGPMPLWRKEMHKKCGLFNKNYIFSNDWDMWLRAVDNGSKFKKIEAVVGLYLAGGLSQSETTNLNQRKEEAKLFYKYKHLFGTKNVNSYTSYFEQFTGETNEQ